jgi:hypothetical protein
MMIPRMPPLRMADRSKRPPGEALVDLRRRLALLSPRDPARREVIARAAEAYGVSIWTIYRAVRELARPKSVRRSDHGLTRAVPAAGMERYAEIIAALKIRTSNKKGRHLSTARAIRLLEEDGVETPDGLVRAPAGLLKRATVDRVLRALGLDHARVTRPIAAVRFQARRSNELWQFDMSPSDLKQVEAPLWMEQGRGRPMLMLFSVVDDRSGVVYDEYRCVYGEDAESALRFLFNAMAPKPEAELPFQGIPATIYMDNGPVSRSKVFQSVMSSLGVRVLTHLPPSQAERRTAARAKGKVERPFRTINEVHEALYHFHKPKDEAEANLWLRRALVAYNNGDHRSEPHSRIEDWLKKRSTGTSSQRACASTSRRQGGADARRRAGAFWIGSPISPGRKLRDRASADPGPGGVCGRANRPAGRRRGPGRLGQDTPADPHRRRACAIGQDRGREVAGGRQTPHLAALADRGHVLRSDAQRPQQGQNSQAARTARA